MKVSKNIGGVLGPTMVVMNITEVINFGIWEVNNPALTYLNGMIIFAAGIAILRAHHQWSRDWTLLVTLYGWILTLGGLFRMAMPRANQLEPSVGAYVVIALLLSGASIMTFKSYQPDRAE